MHQECSRFTGLDGVPGRRVTPGQDLQDLDAKVTLGVLFRGQLSIRIPLTFILLPASLCNVYRGTNIRRIVTAGFTNPWIGIIGESEGLLSVEYRETGPDRLLFLIYCPTKKKKKKTFYVLLLSRVSIVPNVSALVAKLAAWGIIVSWCSGTSF